MRSLIPLLSLCVIVPAFAAPPVNDNFAARIVLTGTAVTTTGTNVDATSEPGENLRNGLFDATVWWSWTAPASGWVRVDTEESSFDTVMQISTGATVGAQTVVAFNDQGPQRVSPDASSITFPATAGTAYHIAVGGWDFGIVDEGTIALHITTGVAAAPPYAPATLTLTPATANVTSAAVPVTASFTVQAASAASHGFAGVGFGWEDNNGDGDFAGAPASWDGSSPGSAGQQSFTAPRYLAPDDFQVWFKIVPNVPGPTLIFSGPDGGSGYALPPAATQVLVVINTGPVDEESPVLTAFSITPASVDVTTAPAPLQISATFTDAPAGVTEVEVLLESNSGVRSLQALLTLTAGTAQAGTWTGSIVVPKGYPTDNYTVYVWAVDDGDNDHSWGTYGRTEIPGGDVDVAVVGGGAYETWAYTYWFDPGDPNAGPADDANGDGMLNLLSYAFDLNPHQPRLSAGSLPLVELTGTGAARKLRLTYLRRKAATNSGLTYLPQFSSGTSGVWETVTGGTATSVNSTFERVVVEDTVTVGTEARRFARVKVESTGQ